MKQPAERRRYTVQKLTEAMILANEAADMAERAKRAMYEAVTMSDLNNDERLQELGLDAQHMHTLYHASQSIRTVTGHLHTAVDTALKLK